MIRGNTNSLGTSRVWLLSYFIGSIWLVSLVNFVAQHGLTQFGVHPRTLHGLIGVLTSPWLHSGFGHLIANTGGLLVLGWLTMWPRVNDFWVALLGGILGAGALAWLIGGSGTVHIGASGVVFGFAGYLIARGYYERSWPTALLAVGVGATYGVSMLLGALPLVLGVSWQSHAGGLLGGVMAAKFSWSKK